jgi:CheY-like chemotaxis protein
MLQESLVNKWLLVPRAKITTTERLGLSIEDELTTQDLLTNAATDHTMNAKRIVLVIDDEHAFCDVVAEILSNNGYEVEKAYDVVQAQSIIQNTRPDLILVDIMMPGVDGLSFIRQLRCDPCHTETPVIVASAKSTPEDYDDAIRAGANDFLIKPFSASTLRNMIDKHMTQPQLT